MIKKDIIYFGQPAVIACDERCDKAWGYHDRPKRYLAGETVNEDDFEFIADDEFIVAPRPDTYEGGVGKPRSNEPKLNKWCSRECERCFFGPPDKEIILPIFGKTPGYKFMKKGVQKRLAAVNE